jgi:phosphomethylpyrimidine synthase
MSTNSLNEQNISIMSSFPGSKKVYVTGSRSDIKVPMREIELSPTTGAFGEEENLPVRVYDTSGPYTDLNYSVDITKGLPAIRSTWIHERADVEEYEGREIKPEDNGYNDQNDPRANHNVFPGLKRKPLRAKKREKCHTASLC